MKAFLGIGLLGSNFVKAMLAKGEQVQVWNRTAEKALVLEADGAKAFEEAAKAVEGADIIHLTLKDDAAVDEVLAKAAAGFKPGAIIIDHSTTSAEGAIKRTKHWKDAGFRYLHAPVFMGPINALESSGVMLVSGDQEFIATVKPELSKMTGKVMDFGEMEGKAAGIKLLGNLFILAVTAGLSDSLQLAKASNISPEDVISLFSEWNPATSLTGRIKKMSAGDFSNPSWELTMARKDAGLMIDTAKAGGQTLITTPSIAEVMDTWIDKGSGSDDWMVISKEI
ncbi:NAD(P)-dependent oxidoreductase [Pedobacter sp. MC2016-14]|uniref:NAD(P)-dependent oxidoreductase n=1 Tax=Pedobacter sp. MC2016-14 TaxID=2897327 RepID=UPI001E58DA90|nr:NAD(P)-dependent oxidoreductase [Pedobacter sp. MC2016-14]MCD0489449.1 NAD(P)-dependent oxidoreductase [Pedobacter sp. MC2016-14]